LGIVDNWTKEGITTLLEGMSLEEEQMKGYLALYRKGHQ
jgi:hypothetical protein